jgi:hypothetical protein
MNFKQVVNLPAASQPSPPSPPSVPVHVSCFLAPAALSSPPLPPLPFFRTIKHTHTFNRIIIAFLSYYFYYIHVPLLTINTKSLTENQTLLWF